MVLSGTSLPDQLNKQSTFHRIPAILFVPVNLNSILLSCSSRDSSSSFLVSSVIIYKEDEKDENGAPEEAVRSVSLLSYSIAGARDKRFHYCFPHRSKDSANVVTSVQDKKCIFDFEIVLMERLSNPNN